NFPIAMTFQPLIGVFAAGNRAMIKMSENSNSLALLLKRVSSKYFPEDKLAFFEDGGGRGAQFTAMPFDHIFFTGSPATGKAVMANAAKNLTPVTLELGGKSPCRGARLPDPHRCRTHHLGEDAQCRPDLHQRRLSVPAREQGSGIHQRSESDRQQALPRHQQRRLHGGH
ncbi:MAG: aldehyde dehydrogenase family protein, partial [Dechloromonas sp.]|nr:aldehyde dehydrogenase family protein [Candidatus Dechloromonas phosphorivorans]